MKNKFNKSIIFYISCIDKSVGCIYINSTTNYDKFSYKFIKDYHKGSVSKKIYQVIRDNGGLLNWEFEILEYVSVNNKMELEAREFIWWDKMMKPTEMPLTYKQILQEVDTIQALKIQNEIYVNNFNQLIQQVQLFGMINNPQPENLLSLVML